MINILSITLSSALALSMLASDPTEELPETTDSGPAQAESASTTAASADAGDALPEATDAGKKMRCKTTRVVNSRIPTRVCMSNEEWEDMERTMREQKRGVVNRNSQCPTSGPC